MDLVFKIRDRGLAVVVIEHDMRFIFNLCDRVLCLVRGENLVEGTPRRCSPTRASSRPTSAPVTDERPRTTSRPATDATEERR